MNSIRTLLLISPLLVTACGVEEGSLNLQPIDRSIAGLDSSGLTYVGPRARPAATFLPASALLPARLSTSQLGGAALVPTGTRGSRFSLHETRSEPHFRLELDGQRGKLYLYGKEELFTPPTAAEVNANALRQASLARLTSLGIPAGERGAVWQKTMMRKDHNQAAAPGYHVTLVDRAFHGVPVRDSRAAVIYDRAGAFSRLRLHWPAVAPETAGNQWGTRMTVAQIIARAQTVLQARGLAERPARLAYQYVPIEENRPDGTTRYALKCTAFVSGRNEAPGQPAWRPIEVDVDLDL